MNRREFVRNTMSAIFLNDLLISITRGLIQEASAQTATTPLRNYVCFWMSDGAERVWFDNILNPNGNDDLGDGATVFNYIDAVTVGSKYNWQYKATADKVNGKYHLPYLWESMLPTSAGGTFAMKNLAANMAIIRGVHTGLTFDAHNQNVEKMQMPFPNQTILGQIADSSNDVLIPAILNNGRFITHANKPASSIGNTDNASKIFNSLKFSTNNSNPYKNAASAKMGVAKLDNVVKSFIASLAPQMPSRKYKAVQVLQDNRSKAVQLLQKGFAGIEADYTAAFDIYMALIASVMNPDSSRILKGLDDKVIRGSNVASLATSFQFWSDLPGFYDSYDLIDGFRQAQCINMAHAFAKAEVYIKHQITNCMQFEISGVSRIAGQHTSNINNETMVKTLTFDVHYTGALMKGVMFSRFYQSFAACLNQFKLKLSGMPGKSGANAWNETLISLRSEFNRGSHNDRGTDHSIRSCVETFFSGAIQDGPIVAGNISVSANSGTHGEGTAVSEIGNQVIDSKFIYSTIGSLMGYTPSRNHSPILAPSGNKIISKVGAPKNVREG